MTTRREVEEALSHSECWAIDANEALNDYWNADEPDDSWLRRAAVAAQVSLAWSQLAAVKGSMVEMPW